MVSRVGLCNKSYFNRNYDFGLPQLRKQHNRKKLLFSFARLRLHCNIFDLINFGLFYLYLSYLYMFSSLGKCAPKYLLILFICIYYLFKCIIYLFYFCIGFSVELYVQGNQQLKRYCSNYYLYLF